VDDDDDEVIFKIPVKITGPTTPGSTCASTVFSPTSAYPDSNVSIATEEELLTPREKLNLFLSSRDISPIRSSLNTPWDRASDRTKRHYKRKASQVVSAALEEIAPQSPNMLLAAIQSIDENKEESAIDSALLEAIVECYENANHWTTRRQIMSIVADKVSFRVIQRWIPGFSRYRYDIARHHALLHGIGSVISLQKQTRMYVSPQQLDHFLSFITSSRIIQDLPFGERTLKLSSKTLIKIPNIIRNSIPEQIVRQYESYSSETEFPPMSRSTLCRILKVCSASTRKSLQGLDYVSSEGSKAFDDLADIVDKIGDNYPTGFSWSKDLTKKLKMAKRYLKGDYKVTGSYLGCWVDFYRTSLTKCALFLSGACIIKLKGP